MNTYGGADVYLGTSWRRVVSFTTLPRERAPHTH
jgi:hypothetical protein